MTAICGLFLWVNKKMAMKQTQTKLFDFSDVGLDFCAGSKSLFPDRFKKMLALGYNVQTVTNVAVVGDQVTFTYGGAHGYVADRVLKVDSGALASISGGEFWIDSVTTNTVTMTIDDAPISVTSGFITRIASLGWDLAYENAHIHIYRFKHIDDADMYARFCFQDNASYRNVVAVGVGRSFDLSTGILTDPNTPTALASCANVRDALNQRMDFHVIANTTLNNANYTTGLASCGKASVVGSLYHFVSMHSAGSSMQQVTLAGILPFQSHYDVINYPVLLLHNSQNDSATDSGFISITRSIAKIQNINVQFYAHSTTAHMGPLAASSYLPASIDVFNTTTTEPVSIYTQAERQFLGVMHGLHRVIYATSAQPSLSPSISPSITYDIDLDNKILVHAVGSNSTSGLSWYCAPVEEVKVGY